MTTYILIREPGTPAGTFGQIVDDQNMVQCCTAELPWNDNEPGKSCIPEGSYTCIRHDSALHPHTWEVTNVPGRTGILIHNGNIPEVDSLGCLCVGESIGEIDGRQAVLNSDATLEWLQNEWPDTFTLVITSVASNAV